MSDKVNPETTPKVEPVQSVNEQTNVTKDIKQNAKKPGYTNPAFRAMGIPAIRFPSRNWMIFWVVVSAGVGGYAYDRYQIKQIRKKWMQRVEHLGQVPLPPNVTARKLTIYVAPPPNDYLDESLAVFRRYVKPVLNAGGVDFEVKSENRQGVIRSLVAADVRALRREYLEAKQKQEEYENSQKWYNKLKSWFSRSSNKELTEEEKKKLNEAEFNYKNLLGTYYKNETWKESEIVAEDSLVTDSACHGGIICIGRGAYKEYITGLHEGLLGPLEKPLDHDEFEKPQDTEAQELGVPTSTENNLVAAPEVKPLDEIVSTETSDKAEDVKTTDLEKTEDIEKTEAEKPEAEKTEAEKTEAEKTEDTTSDFDGQKDEKQLPIPKPFINPTEYPNAVYAPEFPAVGTVKTASGVTAFFQQPVLVIPVYHLLGFLQTPWRIYRFYNQRSYAEEYGRGAVALVENVHSGYKLDDVDLAKEEEDDWPQKWVTKGKEKNSEWTQELITDERVLEKLWVYDSGKIVEKDVAPKEDK